MKIEAQWHWYELLVHPVAVMTWVFSGDAKEKKALSEKHSDAAAYFANHRQYAIAFSVIMWAIFALVIVVIGAV